MGFQVSGDICLKSVSGRMTVRIDNAVGQAVKVIFGGYFEVVALPPSDEPD